MSRVCDRFVSNFRELPIRVLLPNLPGGSSLRPENRDDLGTAVHKVSTEPWKHLK